MDLEDLRYTFEDYQIDFKESAGKYAEKETVFNILKVGYSPSEFEGPTSSKMLNNGLNYNSNVIKGKGPEEILNVLEIDCDLERYNLGCEAYRRHRALYGARGNLERVSPVLW